MMKDERATVISPIFITDILQQSDDFVPLNTRDGNAALFSNVLHDIPILHIS